MATALACCGASCLSNMACSCLGAITDRSSKLARLVYTAIFLLVSVGAWAWYAWGADWYQEKFPKSIIHINCQEDVCFGSMSVYRILGVLTCFYLAHSLLAMICYSASGSGSGSGSGSSINTTWWGTKLILLVGATIAVFFLPNQIFHIWAWVAMIGGAIFLILQLILLVDFAHEWAESWVKNWDQDPDRKGWWYGLLVSTVVLYLATVALTVVEFVMFSAGGSAVCSNNTVFISVNVVLIILEAGISIHPKVQEANPNSGILQSSTVAAYTAYLVWSAMMSQPLGPCNQSTGGRESFSAISGAIFLLVSVCYSTLSVSAKSSNFLIGSSDLEENRTILVEDGTYINNGDNDGDDQPFNYTFFHMCFALASCYATMLITNWMIVTQSSTEAYVIDRSVGSMWVKIASSWVAHLIYIWSLIAPVLFPNRIWS